MRDKTSKNPIYAQQETLSMSKDGMSFPSFLGTRGILYLELIAIAGILLLAPLSREGLWLRAAVLAVALLTASLYLRYGNEQRRIASTLTGLSGETPEDESAAPLLPRPKPRQPSRHPTGQMEAVPDVEDLNIEQDIVVSMPPLARREVTVQVIAVRQGELNVVYDPPEDH